LSWRARRSSGTSRPGGFCEHELQEAGAVAVFDSLETLRERLGETPFGLDGRAPQVVI
jgi:hypothetical protein